MFKMYKVENMNVNKVSCHSRGYDAQFFQSDLAKSVVVTFLSMGFKNVR